MKHFRKICLTIAIVFCVMDKLSAKPLRVINMKIGTTPLDAMELNNEYPRPNIIRFTRSNTLPTEDSKIMRIIDVHQTPQMLGNERGARLHIANGAYPVYYGIARANGQFGKHIHALEANE